MSRLSSKRKETAEEKYYISTKEFNREIDLGLLITRQFSVARAWPAD
jgi:hypothetical protein